MAQSHELSTHVSHRDHPLRAVQARFEGWIPGILSDLYNLGLVHNTPIAHALQRGHKPLPDDVTFSNLWMTVDSAQAITSDGANFQNVRRALVGFSLDGLDGALARQLGIASADGAAKDAIADRLGELHISRLIADTIERHTHIPYSLRYDLMITMQLSTLTKAASEMCGVHTSEGGIGGMIERRRILLATLKRLGSLNHEPNADRRLRIIHKIDLSNIHLIEKSHARALQRAHAIAQSQKHTHTGWNNPDLYDPGSTAATEARKYAIVLALNHTLHLNIEDALNRLSADVQFPSTESLVARFPYISESMGNTREFLNRALAIAGFT